MTRPHVAEGLTVAAAWPPAGRRHSLDVLRIVAICGVVAIHTFSLAVTNESMHGSTQWLLAVALDYGFVWTVPVFVMISGALTLLPRAHSHGPAAFYRKRASRILPALLVWNLVYLFLIRVLLRNEPPSLSGFVQMVIDGQVYTQLYFLWLVLGLYAFAPVLAAFLNSGTENRIRIFAGVALGWTLLVFMTPGITALLGDPRPISLGALTMWWPYVGYFVAGYALSLTRFSFRQAVLAGVAAVVLAALVIWQYANRDALPVLQAINPVGYLSTGVALLALCVFVAAVTALDRVRFPGRTGRAIVALSDASFGVFLVHMAFMAMFQKFAPGVMSGTSVLALAGVYLVILVISYAVSLLAARIPGVRTVF